MIRRIRRAYRLNLAGLPLRRRLRAALRLTRALARRDRPYHMALGVTYECQCRCDHCAMSAYPRDRKEMTEAEIKALLRQARDWGIVKVTFFGGEPLVRPDLEQLLLEACRLGLIVNLSTNGIALDAATAGRLRRIGIAHVDVSLDSPDPTEHDRGRGYPGAFQKAERAIRSCRSVALPASVSVFVSRRLIRGNGLSRLLRLARQLGAASVRLVPPSAVGNLDRSAERLTAQEEQDTLRRACRSGFAYLETQARSGRDCPALRGEFLYVAPDGGVQPCPFVPLACGNVRLASLPAIYAELSRHPLYGSPRTGCPVNDPAVRPLLFPTRTSAGGSVVPLDPPGGAE